MARWLGWGVPSLGTAFLYASLWIHPMPATPTPHGLQSAQLAALRSAAAQSAQNTLPWVSFSWTNSAQPLTTNGSVDSLN